MTPPDAAAAPPTSVFLDRPASDRVAENDLAFALRDGFPVSPGHTLVIPKRLVPTWFDATPAEQAALFALVDDVRRSLDASHAPAGYNLGINVGPAAGQTVMHLHVHVIPRYQGDVDDPTGGVRFVIPESGNYKRPGHLPRRPESPPPAARLTTGGPDAFHAHIHPLLAQATDVSILAAFAMYSGVRALQPDLTAALDRGAHVRLLTGDYLHLTQARALRALLDLSRAETLASAQPDADDLPATRGTLHVRIVEEHHRKNHGSTFHPKSWIFLAPDAGTAFVGSSNLSLAALTDGIEWNLRVDRARDPRAFAEIQDAFDAWWTRATPLDDAFLETYADRAAAASHALPPGEAEPEDHSPPQPRDVQVEALAALARSRAEHRDRAVVVLATGLGKTLLAAFDVQQFARDLGRLPRVLFIAHRDELLRQAASTFRRVFPDARFGWFAGPLSDLAGDFVFASVLKIARPEHIARLAPDAFDYIVVDEVHHADAGSYRRVLDHLRAAFRLGLTATPERADGGDILGLFDDHVAHTADMGEGISRGHLVPFDYLGLKDETDYRNIPWRNGRFDTHKLTEAVQTQRRMERLLEAWEAHPAQRTLVFTCSIAHAAFTTRWLNDRGIRSVALHSGADSADRIASVDQLAAGDLDALVTVDLFNEGVDLPTVDRVVMLRPTESPVIFLQQLGRGLRVAPGKQRLTVIDFVGNHKVFLHRVHTLVNLGKSATPVSVAAFLAGTAEPALPQGCSVDVELEAKDILRRLLPSGDKHALVRAYRELRALRDARPTAGEMIRMGLNPASLKAHDTWFDFVDSEGNLTGPEKAALHAARGFLQAVERREKMTKSYKMVALEALLEADALTTGLPIDELSARSLAILLRDPELEAELPTKELGDPRSVSADTWTAYWTKWPLHHWTTAKPPLFRLTDTRFEPTFTIPADAREALVAMTRELVDYRLASYRRTKAATSSGASGTAFEARLIHNTTGVILKLPNRDRFQALPTGPTDIRLPDGRLWTFDFAKIAVNVARPVGSQRNQLTDLLRSWFGPDAGQPGTAFHVRFAPSPDGWWVEPVETGDARVIPLPIRGRLTAFPTLYAAAGWSTGGQTADAIDASEVALPGDFDPEKHFAIRASGTSMEGAWRGDIKDGDWLVMRWARGDSLPSLLNNVGLFARQHDDDTRTFHIKRLIQSPDRKLYLSSDNPDVAPMPTRPGDEPLARLVAVLHPDSLAPRPGTLIPDDVLAAAFGLSAPPEPPASRTDGHLFILAEAPGSLSAPDRLPRPVHTPRPHPGETAYVLIRPSPTDPWRYAGLGRYLPDEDAYRIAEVDFPTWRALGKGRSASRRLAPEHLESAKRLVADLLSAHPPGTWLGPTDRRFRLLGQAPQGGLRIDGGPDGFAERTVSLTDLAWTLAAQWYAQSHDAHLDEALVNRLRYLDGTPKESTRWIDTGWALALLTAHGA